MTPEPGSSVAPSLFAPLGPTYDRYSRLLSLGQDPRWRRWVLVEGEEPPTEMRAWARAAREGSVPAPGVTGS